MVPKYLSISVGYPEIENLRYGWLRSRSQTPSNFTCVNTRNVDPRAISFGKSLCFPIFQDKTLSDTKRFDVHWVVAMRVDRWISVDEIPTHLQIKREMVYIRFMKKDKWKCRFIPERLDEEHN